MGVLHADRGSLWRGAASGCSTTRKQRPGVLGQFPMAKRSGSLESLSIADLQRELKRRERGSVRMVGKLERKRAKMLEALAEIDAQIAAMGGKARASAAGGRRRPHNDDNLADALAKVLKGNTLSVTEAAAHVQKAGYVTTSPNFRTIVNQTLLKDNRFKRVGRGQYTTKG